MWALQRRSPYSDVSPAGSLWPNVRPPLAGWLERILLAACRFPSCSFDVEVERPKSTQVKSLEEAVEWVKRMPAPDEGEEAVVELNRAVVVGTEFERALTLPQNTRERSVRWSASRAAPRAADRASTDTMRECPDR